MEKHVPHPFDFPWKLQGGGGGKRFFCITMFVRQKDHAHLLEKRQGESETGTAFHFFESIFKLTELAKMASEAVDINGIGYYTLGKHRKSISAASLEKYLDLFEKYFLKSFSSRLVVYTNPEITIIGEEILSSKYTIVNSILKSTDDRPEIKIDWRVYTKNPDKILIRDIIIEGVSLARAQKEEFNSVIENNNGDIAKLFATLEEFISK